MDFGEVDFSESIFEIYDRARVMTSQMIASWKAAIVRNSFKESVHSALDLGCGTGRFSRLLSEALDSKVIGVEPSLEMLEQAELVASKSMRFVLGNCEEIPVENDTVDLVWMSMVLHHLKDHDVCAREISRVLTTNGRCLVRNNFKGRLNGLPYYTYFPSAKEIDEVRMPDVLKTLRAFESNGFVLQSMETVIQLADISFANHIERIRLKGLSTLSLISDKDFKEGLIAMEKQTDFDKSAPVYELIDLLTFQKHD